MFSKRFYLLLEYGINEIGDYPDFIRVTIGNLDDFFFCVFRNDCDYIRFFYRKIVPEPFYQPVFWVAFWIFVQRNAIVNSKDVDALTTATKDRIMNVTRDVIDLSLVLFRK